MTSAPRLGDQGQEKTMSTINSNGLAQIKKFLSGHHKLGGAHFDEAMLAAWAADAEYQMSIGNPPTIEIRSFDATDGRAIEYTISVDGVGECDVIDGEVSA